MTLLDVSPLDKAIVLNILKKNLPPNTTVYVFGSRARNIDSEKILLIPSVITCKH